MPNPYGLPHPDLRPAQQDAIKRILLLHQGGGGVIFIDAPVGIGKTAIAAALATVDKVTVMTSTLELLTQYESKYAFTAIRGRQWYKCVYPKKMKAWKSPYPPTAFDCHFSNMRECPSASECPYLAAKIAALTAQKSIMSYRYGALSSSIARRGGFLVFDECDVSVKEIVSHAELQITADECKQYSFPPLPKIETGVLKKTDELISWLYKSDLSLPEYNPTNPLEMALAGEIEKKHKKLQRTIESLEGTDWFVNVQDDTLILKPLTASKLAQFTYQNKRTIVCMSATVGDPVPLAKQLGIETYTHIEYPHPTPPEYRPVYAMQGAPRMSYSKAGLDDPKYLTQGILLWQLIHRTLEPSWRGICLTSSKAKADKLYSILAPRLDRPILTGQSSILIDQFKKDTRKGLLAIGYLQGWSHGVDLYGDMGRFSIIASVPFPSDTDPYITALRLYDKRFYEYNVYSAIPQGIGRVTRGERLENGEWLRNVGILADRRAWDDRATGYYPEWFKESIIA